MKRVQAWMFWHALTRQEAEHIRNALLNLSDYYGANGFRKSRAEVDALIDQIGRIR